MIGLTGKLPARGDFVRRHLPRDFADPWEHRWQETLLAARLRDPDWAAAWLQAPVWHFALAPGICGTDAVHGVVLPSVDAAGRYFPLTIAAYPFAGWDDDFLAASEQAARDAIASDIAPDDVLAGLASPAGGAGAPGCRWRTEGAPLVAAREFVADRLPQPAELLGMLNDGWRKDTA